MPNLIVIPSFIAAIILKVLLSPEPLTTLRQPFVFIVSKKTT